MKRSSGNEASAAKQHPAVAGMRMTRTQVADRLGISIAGVRRMEGKSLHPTKEVDGVWRFDAADVEALAAERTSSSSAKLRRSDAGELAAEAYTLFQKGLAPRQVVIELRQPPDAIETLHRKWRQGGGLWLPSADVTEIRESITSRYQDAPTGRIRCPEDLLNLLDQVLFEIDETRRRLRQRADKLRELERDQTTLREKLRECRLQLAEWQAQAEKQGKAECVDSAADEDSRGDSTPPDSSPRHEVPATAAQ